MEENKNIQEENKIENNNQANSPNEVKNNVQNNPPTKSNNGLIGILIAIIILLTAVVIYMLFFNKPKEELKENNEQTQSGETNINNQNEVKENNEDKKYELTVYKYKDDGRICDATEENKYVEEAFKIKVSTKDAKLLSADNESLFVVYKDNGVKIYNVKNKTVQKIDLQDNFKEYKAFLNEARNKLVGIVIKDNADNIGYYNLSSNKLFYYNIKYKNADNELPLINQINDDYFSLTTNDKAYLLNANHEKIELNYSFNEENDVYCEYIGEKLGNKYIYFLVESNPEVYTHHKVYNSNLKLFYSADYIEYSTYKDSLFIVVDNVIRKYNASGEMIKSYSGYSSIEGLYNNYVIYTDNNSKLILQNIEETSESKELVKIEKNYYIWYNYYTRKILDEMGETNKKEGLYIIVEYGYDNKGNSIKDSKGNYGMEYCYTPDKKIIEYPIKQEIGGRAKPVLYLYPETETNVTVKFSHPEYLTTTYPKYNNEWKVIVKPNGDMKGKDGKYYYALYWDEKRYNEVDFKEGFYVESKDAIKFLEEKLAIIGLNDKERNEFIMYWLPIMESNKKNLVYFELTEERELGNKLIIEPKPDSLLRVSIHIKKVNEKVSIKEQKLSAFNRHGFTAVEWGGMTY